MDLKLVGLLLIILIIGSFVGVLMVYKFVIIPYLDIYNWSIIVFIIMVAVYVYNDRHKFERDSIVLLRRTQRGKALIIKLGEKFPRFWKTLGTIGVGVGFAASVWVVFTLVENIFKLISKPGGAGLAFVLPSPSPTATLAPGVLAVPFWYWIIAIALLVVVHEGLHGIMAAMQKIKIKSLGWGLLLIIPLAFVEPDEKKLQKRSFLTQQRVFAAGSFANFMTALIFFGIIIALTNSVTAFSGVAFESLTPGMPAEKVSLEGIIVGINNHQIKNFDDLSRVLTEIGPNKEITIKTKVPEKTGISEKTYTLTTAVEPNSTSNKAMIGINGVAQVNILKPELSGYAGIINFFQGLFTFIFIINLGVGLANLLPIKPLDGGRMWEEVFRRVSKKRYKAITRYVGLATLVLIIANFVLPTI